MAGSKIWYWLKLVIKTAVILFCTLIIISVVFMTLEEIGIDPDGKRTESEIKESLDWTYYEGDYRQLLQTLRWYCGEEEADYEKYWNMGRFYEAYTMKEYWEEQVTADPDSGYEAYVQKYEQKMQEEYQKAADEENLRIMDTILKK